MKEFNLSDKIWGEGCEPFSHKGLIQVEDVKEFIKREMALIVSCFIKEEIDYPTFLEKRNKLTGDLI